MSRLVLPITNQQVGKTSATQLHPLGTLAQTQDGRKYRYARANASTALVRGNLVVSANPEANHQNRLIDNVVTAPATGDKQVTLLSIGATALTVDQYRDGYLSVRDETGEGDLYQISGHSVYASDATDVVVNLRDPLTAALASTTEVSLEYSPYANVVVSATDQLDNPVGIVPVAVLVSDYFWAQTGGMAVCWADEAYGSGSGLTIGTGTAGQVEAIDLIGETLIGTAVRAGVDAEHSPIFLTLD